MCSTSVSDQVCDLNLITLFSLRFSCNLLRGDKNWPSGVVQNGARLCKATTKGIWGYGSPHIVYSFNTCELLAAINMTKY